VLPTNTNCAHSFRDLNELDSRGTPFFFPILPRQLFPRPPVPSKFPGHHLLTGAIFRKLSVFFSLTWALSHLPDRTILPPKDMDLVFKGIRNAISVTPNLMCRVIEVELKFRLNPFKGNWPKSAGLCMRSFSLFFQEVATILAHRPLENVPPPLPPLRF